MHDVEHAAVRVLADAHSLDDAHPQILEGIGAALDWQVGAVWVVDRTSQEDQRLACVDLWHRDDPSLLPFVDASRRHTFERGVKAAADLIERSVLELQEGQARDDFALVILGVRASIFRRVRTPRLWGRRATPDALDA